MIRNKNNQQKLNVKAQSLFQKIVGYFKTNILALYFLPKINSTEDY
jgi:hypothetical protein